MKVIAKVYDFVTGGSIVAPIGVAVALLTTRLTGGLPPGARAAVFFGTIFLTFVASAYERAR